MAGGQPTIGSAERAILALEAAQEKAPELNLDASRLLTFTGYTNALADLAERAKCGGDRDENASMNVEIKALKMFAEIHAKVLEHQLDLEGTRKLQDLLDQIGRRESGATTSWESEPDLPTARDPEAH